MAIGRILFIDVYLNNLPACLLFDIVPVYSVSPSPLLASVEGVSETREDSMLLCFYIFHFACGNTAFTTNWQPNKPGDMEASCLTIRFENEVFIHRQGNLLLKSASEILMV